MNLAANTDLASLEVVLKQAEALLIDVEKLASKIALKRGRDKKRRFTGEIRVTVAERDGFKCRYCGVLTHRGHVDHVIPHSQGGRTNALNAAWSCPRCNCSKGARVW